VDADSGGQMRFRRLRAATPPLPSDNGTGLVMNRTSFENDDRFSVTQIWLMFGSILGCLVVMAMTIALLSTSTL
jgi:hypothetical protein